MGHAAGPTPRQFDWSPGFVSFERSQLSRIAPAQSYASGSLAEGIWWRREESDTGELTLANTGDQPELARYRLTGARGMGLQWREVALPAHALERIGLHDRLQHD